MRPITERILTNEVNVRYSQSRFDKDNETNLSSHKSCFSFILG